MENDFLKKLESVLDEHLSEENFGVSELAEAVAMSRSNLLRKIKRLTGLSASQYIRNVRLARAKELLKDGSLNVSEVSYKVGFGSTSYFIKCFRELYGIPPGEMGKSGVLSDHNDIIEKAPHPRKQQGFLVLMAAIILLVVVGVVYFQMDDKQSTPVPPDKSIAVLPFKNDSNDTTNVYLINGLMEATLDNLQKIKDLRVVSRTTVEKYRDSRLTIPELARELQVSYFVEGSGQKVGDQIMLHIQLIAAEDDRHLWSQQYRRQVSDIFSLQQEIATNIADEVEVLITPEELELIELKPTQNLAAYDAFLQGSELLRLDQNGNNLRPSIPYFEAAIEKDPEFGLAYAALATVYYYLDIFRKEKQYLNELSSYADKALLYAPTSDRSLVAKAFYYKQQADYQQAAKYLEKALEYKPYSAEVISELSDLYASYIPNTSKYLEYALRGIKVKTAGEDSTTISYLYLHVGNALIQNGFVDESLYYIERSRAYYPDNPYTNYVKAYILYAKEKDLQATLDRILIELAKDQNRVDILQEAGKLLFYLGKYEEAYTYYARFDSLVTAYQLDIYPQENLKQAMVYEKMGKTEQAKVFLEKFRNFMESDQSIYQDLTRFGYEVYQGNYNKALEHLRQFSKQDDIQFWIVLFMECDPELEPLKDHPEFKEIMAAIKKRFWDNHARIRSDLEEKGLI